LRNVRARPSTKAPKTEAPRALEDEVQTTLVSLEQMATKRDRENLARFGITANKAFGVSMANIQVLAKHLGRSHTLAAALWDTGWYEARMLTSFVDEPTRVTPTQMDRWCHDFDNWGICDTVCFHLFDRTPYAWQKVAKWGDQRDEFVKRAAFALLWGLTVHDKHADDALFAEGLRLVERAATDERHLVKKSVNMALRAIGKRNRALNDAAVAVARHLANSPQAAARWVGRDALRELTSASVIRRLAAK
jgi:3-methyladenine DNA glycosylase AlkD